MLLKRFGAKRQRVEIKGEAEHAPNPLQQGLQSPAGKDALKAVWSEATKVMEPTIGIEPMTCRLRIDCSTN
jgi:hypothetical protein